MATGGNAASVWQCKFCKAEIPGLEIVLPNCPYCRKELNCSECDVGPDLADEANNACSVQIHAGPNGQYAMEQTKAKTGQTGVSEDPNGVKPDQDDSTEKHSQSEHSAKLDKVEETKANRNNEDPEEQLGSSERSDGGEENYRENSKCDQTPHPEEANQSNENGVDKLLDQAEANRGTATGDGNSEGSEMEVGFTSTIKSK